MAEDLKVSTARVKRSTRSIETSITPAEAASLLTSALAYCEKAGLKIRGYNEDGKLFLSIAGVEYQNRKVVVVTPKEISGDTKPEIGVTIVSESHTKTAEAMP